MADGHTFTAPQTLAPGYRPGERLLHGKPYVFNADLLRAYEAEQAIAMAPADLARLSYPELSTLVSAYLNREPSRPRDPALRAFGERVCAERARRPEYVAVFGGAA